MKKIVYVAAMLLSVSCFRVNPAFHLDLSSKNGFQAEGPVSTKELDLMGFHSIEVNGGADVDFTQGEGWKVTLTTQESVFDSLDYKVEDSTLVIQLKHRREVRAEEYKITIQAPSLQALTVNGASDFDLKSALKTDGDLKIAINGAGELDLSGGLVCRGLDIRVNGAADLEAEGIDVASLKVQINGAGDVELTGKAGEADLEVNGAGDIDARGLEVAGKVRKHAAGIAKIRL